MKLNAANNLCSYNGDMLAYLYNEMAPADREMFETHLADCGSCIDDFAELSQSRYPVFQWKKAEFDPLATPDIAIPYRSPLLNSWTQKIRAVFAFRPTLAFGSAAAAVFAVILTGVLLFGGSASDQELARDIEPTASPVRAAPTVAATGDPASKVMTQEPVPYVAPKAVQTSVTKSTLRVPKPRASQTKKRNESIPVLSSVEDEEDDSLRLTDIFDEIGTSE